MRRAGSRVLDSIRSIGDDVGMTVVDERAKVPPLSMEALARLAHTLNRDGVVAAMLIGSQARASAGPLSDVDVGIWHEPGLGPAERLKLQMELAAAASEALGTDEVDIVLLNRATPLMRHRAIRDAQRLVERDPKTRVQLEAKGILDYLDTKPLRAELARGVRHRIEEGRFGRR